MDVLNDPGPRKGLVGLVTGGVGGVIVDDGNSHHSGNMRRCRPEWLVDESSLLGKLDRRRPEIPSFGLLLQEVHGFSLLSLVLHGEREREMINPFLERVLGN